jgi:hypothetical protein
VIHRRDLIDEVGGWDPHYYFDDYELWLRISGGYELHHLTGCWWKNSLTSRIP